MEIPDPRSLREANKGKKYSASEQEAENLTPEQIAEAKQEKVQQQTQELMAKCIQELQKYKGATIIVGAKYCYKEAIANVMESFNDTGAWRVKKGYSPEDKEVVLKFTGVG